MIPVVFRRRATRRATPWLNAGAALLGVVLCLALPVRAAAQGPDLTVASLLALTVFQCRIGEFAPL